MNSVVEKEMLIFYSGDCLVNFGESDCCFITIQMTMMMTVRSSLSYGRVYISPTLTHFLCHTKMYSRSLSKDTRILLMLCFLF